MRSLFIVDLQNDFCPGGELAVPEGDRIVPVINELIDRFDLVLASKDWHPEDSVHFDKWPPHCVKGTEGAEFHPDLNSDRIDQVFLKGTGDRDDGYSAFEAANIELEDYLNKKDVEELFIVGLATEYCVSSTAIDAASKGFSVAVVEDAVAGIDEEDVKEAKEEMTDKGIYLISSDQIE